MKTIRVYPDWNSSIIKEYFSKDTILYGFEVAQLSNEEERAIVLDEPVGIFNFSLYFNRKTGSTTGQNFLVDPVELAAL